MGKEIERKFLVKGEFKNFSIKEIKIDQAYLSVDPFRIVRIRNAGLKSYITIKGIHSEGKQGRDEWEFEIPAKTGREIMEICLPGKIIKTRYIVPYKDHIFEVDEFHDKNEGLVVAEIELSAENEYFEKPDWLGEEVTGKPEYQNSNLRK